MLFNSVDESGKIIKNINLINMIRPHSIGLLAGGGLFITASLYLATLQVPHLNLVVNGRCNNLV